MKDTKLKNYLIIALFFICGILSIIFASKVTINYNLSNYLSDQTQTKIALEIIDDEFGMTGNIQVMVSNISRSDASNLADKIEDIDNVVNVNFDKLDENYYKDGNALYIVIVNGDDYSSEAKQVSDDIKELVSNYETVNFGGTVTEKEKLKNSITSEMVYIIAIAICLVVIILLITSASWVEPIILLISSGIAIFINKGTNIIFGEISYITNSISQVLQLALSIDYSIVLLSTYRRIKNEEMSSNEAMKRTIKEVLSPVSASSLTTIVGLLALLFMSFKIGFDIGIVLMKGILISAIASLTLLPSLIIVSDKLISKTKKESFEPKGSIFAKFSLKFNKIICPVALVVLIICAIGQSHVNYSFTDSKAANTNITDIFGNNNTVVVVYKNTENNYSNEEELIKQLSDYKLEENKDVLKNYTAYTNTVREVYGLDELKKKLDLTDNEALLLLTMYNLYKDPELVTLNFNEFVDFAYYLTQNDEDAMEQADGNTIELINLLETVAQLNKNSFTSSQFTNVINDLDANSYTSEFSIKQLYGLYQYKSLEEDKVDYQTMLKFIIKASKNENLKGLFDSQTIENLTKLSSGIDSFVSTCNALYDKETTKQYFKSNYNVDLTDEQLNNIYESYYKNKGEEVLETIPYLNLMEYLVKLKMIEDENTISTINSYRYLYNVVLDKYSYTEFLTTTQTVAKALSREDVNINTNSYSIQQLYILYYYQIATFGDIEINGAEFINFILDTYETKPLIKAQMSDETITKLKDLTTLFKALDNQTKMSYVNIANSLDKIRTNLSSIETNTMDIAKISGVYIKYSVIHGNGLTDSMMAYELLDFITSNMDNSSILKSKLDENKKIKINDASNKLIKAKNLFVGTNYSRMLLTLDLANESDETIEFVEYLSNEVKQIFGDNAYITGEIVSTYDLKSSFSHDNTFITIFTLISIFLIVALVFRSLSIPTILIVIIEGAIFIAMSTQLVCDNIFFMSYIITTCILMGSTIDYGILMSSNYAKLRETNDKTQSIRKAIEIAMPTIFTSGMILIICGFVICFVSSQNSISTVGRLIGIGTICSVLMILVVLPSVLYLLDKFVLKFTYRKDK